MALAVLEVISSWQVWELSMTTRSAKERFAEGHTSRVSTGALAAKVQVPGPLRGTSTTCPPASTPATTPFETPASAPDPLELSFEAVAVTELRARGVGGRDDTAREIVVELVVVVELAGIVDVGFGG